MHLSSQHLKIETGRWARITPEQQTCTCTMGIQNEEYVMLTCPISQPLRQMKQMNYDGMSELFKHDILQLEEYCKQIFNLHRT